MSVSPRWTGRSWRTCCRPSATGRWSPAAPSFADFWWQIGRVIRSGYFLLVTKGYPGSLRRVTTQKHPTLLVSTLVILMGACGSNAASGKRAGGGEGGEGGAAGDE